MIRVILLGLIIFIVSGCSKEEPVSPEDFLGIWERMDIDEGSIGSVLKVSRDEQGNYTFLRNILTTIDYRGEEILPSQLEIEEGQLFYSNKLRNEKQFFQFSEDRKTLLFSDAEYKNISDQEFAVIQSEYETKMARVQQDKELCKEIRDAYKKELKQMNIEETDEIKDKYQGKADVLIKCDL